MVSHSGTSFPTKTLSKSSPKSSHRSPSKQGCTKCINWNYSRRVDHRTNETRDLSKDHIYKNKKFSNTTKEVVKNDDFKEKPQIIMVHHENLITFKNDVNIFSTDKKHVNNNLSKYVNTNGTNSQRISL